MFLKLMMRRAISALSSGVGTLLCVSTIQYTIIKYLNTDTSLTGYKKNVRNVQNNTKKYLNVYIHNKISVLN